MWKQKPDGKVGKDFSQGDAVGFSSNLRRFLAREDVGPAAGRVLRRKEKCAGPEGAAFGGADDRRLQRGDAARNDSYGPLAARVAGKPSRKSDDAVAIEAGGFEREIGTVEEQRRIVAAGVESAREDVEFRATIAP